MAYPKNGNSQKKRAARKTFLEAVQRNLDAQAQNEKLAWVKHNFDRIGAVPMHGNQAIASLDDVEQAARRKTSVEVRVDQTSGEINHLHGTD